MPTDPNPFDAYHDAPLTYDAQGIPTADVPFTPKEDTKRYAVIVPPSKVIPVVFLPGIMGSNLRLKSLPEGFAGMRYASTSGTVGWGDMAWRPDDGADFMARRLWPLEAADRRALLDPNNTQVDDRADIPAEILDGFTFGSAADGRDQEALTNLRRNGFINEMKRRGWGTVMVSSYGPLLAYLERNLNQMFHRGELSWFWRTNIVDRLDRRWGITHGHKALTQDNVKKAARYWLPVHAIGYNWLESNRDSALYAVDKINAFIDHYKAMQYECDHVILITHSMGGLVARAVVHPAIGGLEGKVLGVIHGVMPTHGAPAAYRRCRAGFEGGGLTSKAGATARLLGRDGPEVAAVFSNSPGALQLLPSKLYGTNWLRMVDEKGKEMLSLPKADPYKEIYEERDAWWRLMNPQWLNPKPRTTKKAEEQAWSTYLKNLDKARDFHELINKTQTHHRNTFVHYGTDAEDFRAFGTVTWQFSGSGQLQGNPLESTKFADDPSGGVTLQDVISASAYRPRFKLSDRRDEAGDGTVPIRSAKALNESVELVAEHTGYDHQGSYGSGQVQELTAYGVVRLIADYA
jgi:pimeloyl-ACP methyl ester carboxylesterase